MKRFRWVKTAPEIWQLESPPESKRFHGTVCELSNGRATFCLPWGWWVWSAHRKAEEHGHGQRDSVSLAKDEVERLFRETKVAE
jgi:hypothetical protein